jgi:molybdate transport system ATP-binding protein
MHKHLKVNISFSRPGFSLTLNETFEAGITGVFGKSGSGKTTLLQCISGFETPHNGSIKSNERTLYSSDKKENIPSHKRRVGYVFQEGRLFPHLSVRKNLLYGSSDQKSQHTLKQLERVVSTLNIVHLIDKNPDQLSGGERQRIALGRALLASPEILLLDEPFSALDQSLRQQIIPYISKIARLLNIPVLIVSHDLPDIIKLTNRLCLISEGKVVAHDDYESLVQNKLLFNLIPATNTLNSVTLKIKSVNTENGMITLNGFGNGEKVNVLFEPNNNSYKTGGSMKIFLRPDHIILAKNRIEGTSFRNQIKGRITETFDEGARMLCLVDCGFPLLAEVSKAAGEELELKKDSPVYCLFKTLSLDALPV